MTTDPVINLFPFSLFVLCACSFLTRYCTNPLAPLLTFSAISYPLFVQFVLAKFPNFRIWEFASVSFDQFCSVFPVFLLALLMESFCPLLAFRSLAYLLRSCFPSNVSSFFNGVSDPRCSSPRGGTRDSDLLFIVRNGRTRKVVCTY